ncbi:PilW family protein [Pseudomonas sp. SLFW]|uniref:PilW family protein n=1 Tax=Pseudomonas sp. SLFW TaxID=2683259 RepID=UPI001411CBDA|nr:prepilin-type N-terminal cleavage/methylation domain-containing protein [Pseudomonas sp. SLFW]NBB12030.1 prepilin-type N-terminal cleavage/methylation domain-containing protein [Pseudomonas sp. SLFW]
MRCSANLSPSRGTQRGLSLIELMVAMVIGLILILGVTQIFINNQKSYLFQQGQMGNQENSRFALALLNQELSKAGYRSKPIRTFPAGSGQGCTFPEGAAVVAAGANALCIRYQAANKGDVNCQGTALAGGDQDTIITPYGQNNPIVVEKISYDSGSSSILCSSGSTPQQLVTGVAALNFDYGSGQSDLKTVSGYSTTPGGTIGAVRYTILMMSPGSSSLRDTAAASQALTEWKNRFGSSPVETNQIYQIVQGTTMIRNQMQ